MVAWHHQLSGHEFEQTPGDSEGQGSLACRRPRGRKELDMTEWLNNKCPENKIMWYFYVISTEIILRLRSKLKF